MKVWVANMSSFLLKHLASTGSENASPNGCEFGEGRMPGITVRHSAWSMKVQHSADITWITPTSELFVGPVKSTWTSNWSFICESRRPLTRKSYLTRCQLQDTQITRHPDQQNGVPTNWTSRIGTTVDMHWFLFLCAKHWEGWPTAISFVVQITCKTLIIRMFLAVLCVAST